MRSPIDSSWTSRHASDVDRRITSKNSHKTMLRPGRAQELGLNQDFLYDGGAKSIFS